MLVWQAYSYEMASEWEIAAKGPPKHDFFDPVLEHQVDPSYVPPHPHVADVRQIGY